MKAADFDYARPDTLEAALALLADDGREAALIAGGQSLMPMMNFRLAQPELLIDLSALDDLRGISLRDGALRIGAMTRYAELMASDPVAAHAPLLARALPMVAHSAIRNRGTLGGSLALADPAAEMPAVLLALGGSVEVAGPDGPRSIAAEDLFLGAYETALTPGDVLTSITLPTDADATGFHEIARRHGDYAMAGVALARRGDDWRVAFFGVADRAVRSRATEAALAQGADPDAPDDIDYTEDQTSDAATKRHLAGVVLRRALKEMT